MSGRIAISIGDVTGIGPEVTLKALSAELSQDSQEYLLLGDDRVLEDTNRRLGLGLSFKDRLRIANPHREILPCVMPPGDSPAARAALAWLREGARLCLAGECKALVTAPLNKESIIRSGQKFVGQTEFLSELAGTEQTCMMLLGADDRDRWLRVALATTHVPLRKVAAELTREKIERAIILSARACADLGLKRARIGVCGLNPHAGEGGQLGMEEVEIVAPAVRAAREKMDAHGPLAADTLFYHAYRGEFDAVVAMYHDQGLVPLKMIGFERGVNWTLGLPFIRTSPDHGTAYDIAGRGLAEPGSMVAALRLAKELMAKRR